MKSINPATLELNVEIKEHSIELITEKLDKAQETYNDWRTLSVSERSKFAQKLSEILTNNIDEYATIITQEVGKPITQSKAEIKKCAWVSEYYGENAVEFLKDELVETEYKKSYISFEPVGILLAVMPWNYPFWQVFRFAVGAILAGNVVVLKHASNVPLSAIKIEEIFKEAGFPEGVFTTLLVGSDKVEGIIKDQRVRGVMLTGSEKAGRQVASIAGLNGKKSVLELGGSDPFVVLKDADIEKAVYSCAVARLQNAGQACICAKRIIVEESIAEKFTQKLLERFKHYKIGDTMDETTEIGPLSSEKALEEIESQVERSVEMGAKILTGGSRVGDFKGYYYQPTIIIDVKENMPIFMEESFGPITPIIIANDYEDAIRIANTSRYGLGASIWTNNEVLISKAVKELEAGVVFVNGVVSSDPRLPIGGSKDSGYGRELGEYGIKEFTNIKSIVVN
jgi:succinate-semialdehyde dehydrogenase / glutarate-semialdehyde dehydrogenase